MRTIGKKFWMRVAGVSNVLLFFALSFGLWQELREAPEQGSQSAAIRRQLVNEGLHASAPDPNEKGVSPTTAYSEADGPQVTELPEARQQVSKDVIQERLLAVPPGGDASAAIRAIANDVDGADAEEMVAWLEEFGQHFKADDRWLLLSAFTKKWAEVDFESASGYVLGREDLSVSHQHVLVGRSLLPTLYRRNDDDAVEAFIQSIPSEEVRARVWFSSDLVDDLVEHDREALFTRLDALQDEETRKSAIYSVTRRLSSSSSRNPYIISDLLNSQLPEKNEILTTVGYDWISRDMNAGLEWVGSLDDAELRGAIIDRSWELIANVEPETARAWIEQISDEEDRASALRSFEKKYNQREE